MRKFIIDSGIFEEANDSIIFCGGVYDYRDKNTGDQKEITKGGMIRFPESYKDGEYSFDVVFSQVNKFSRVAFVLNYKNINGKTTFYHVGMRNSMGAYGLDYYDGEKWDFRLTAGMEGVIQGNQKYQIKVRIKGSKLQFYIDGACIFTYTNYTGTDGVCGIYVCSCANAIIENICFKPKCPTAFVIMKFEDDFDDLYNDVIVPKCNENGFMAVRADEIYTSSSIIQDIIREISEASLIIADVTMDNPNVFYELGYAHALQKPVILLADIEKRGRLPFDISIYRTIFYNNTIGGKKLIESRLENFLKAIIA